MSWQRSVIFAVVSCVCALLTAGSLSAATEATTEITARSSNAVVDQAAGWLKKNLALTATQVESLMAGAGKLRTEAEGMSEAQLSDALNRLLTEARISGVQILNRHDPLFWLYRERFGLAGPEVPAQVPAWLTKRGRNWHVWLAANIPGSDPAALLTRGDEIIFETGDPFSFGQDNSVREGKTAVKIKTLAHGQAVPKTVPLAMKSTGQLLADIVRTHARQLPLSDKGDRSAGYLPMPTADLPALRDVYTGLLEGFAKSSEALILDLRGPFGEGGLSGIDLFLTDKGDRRVFKGKLYVLVDRYTAGGREALAGVLQRHAGAVLIGEQTAGVSAPVEIADLDPGRFLLIATRDQKDELGPVKPDHALRDTLAYVAGRDDILDKALAVASGAAK